MSTTVKRPEAEKRAARKGIAKCRAAIAAARRKGQGNA